MSEYQHYEFQAIDRNLTDEEMKELRACCARADITSNSFVNGYSWENFKGDEDLWMEKYFDGFLYYANWGTHVFKLKLSSALLDLETVAPYCNEHLCARLYGDHIILEFLSNDESGEHPKEEQELHLSIFLSLRSDLARGDLRCLYLAWLAGIQHGEYSPDQLEPPVPLGLSNLTPSLLLFVEFFRIDADLINAASKTSLPLIDEPPTGYDFRKWINSLALHEKDELLVNILAGYTRGDANAGLYAVHRFNATWYTPKSQSHQNISQSPRRTVGELAQAAKHTFKLREQFECEHKAARIAEQQLAKEKYLNEIAEQESDLWDEVERLAAEKNQKNYEKALKLLINLRTLAVRKNSDEFKLRLHAFKQRHAGKSGLIKLIKNLK